MMRGGVRLMAPNLLFGEPPNAVPIGRRWVAAQVRDALEINSARAIIRREAAAYLELRRGCFPVLLPVGVETLRKRVAQFELP